MILVWLVRCDMRYGWTLISSHWGVLRKVVREFLGESPDGKLVRLTPQGGRFIPDLGGVYMLCAHPPKCDLPMIKPPQKAEMHLFNALYIGEAEDLRVRYKNYAMVRNISGKGKDGKVRKFLKTYDNIYFCYWAMAPEAGQQERKKLQDVMIECFGPTANTQGGGRTMSGYLQSPIPA